MLQLGDKRRANERRLAMYIHPEVAPSCLLLMGITDLAEGSVWNTMPPHLHERRMGPTATSTWRRRTASSI